LGHSLNSLAEVKPCSSAIACKSKNYKLNCKKIMISTQKQINCKKGAALFKIPSVKSCEIKKGYKEMAVMV